MRIHQYGSILFEASGAIGIDGWVIEREPDDPVDATNEQLVLTGAIRWAQKRLQTAILESVTRDVVVRSREFNQGQKN